VQNHGAVAAANIVALIRAGDSASQTTPPKSYKAGPQLMIVSVGTKGGAGQLFGFTVGVRLSLSFTLSLDGEDEQRADPAHCSCAQNWFSSFVKSKSLFVSDFKKMYGATA